MKPAILLHTRLLNHVRTRALTFTTALLKRTTARYSALLPDIGVG